MRGSEGKAGSRQSEQAARRGNSVLIATPGNQLLKQPAHAFIIRLSLGKAD